MTRGTKRTLLAIAVFVAAMVATFIWFVATWDPSREEPVSRIVVQPAQGQA